MNSISAEADDLPVVVAEWHHWTDANRASYSLDWDHLMLDYLTELDEYWQDGCLSADQPARYHELIRKLDRALPLLERLRLCLPPIPLAARLATLTASATSAAGRIGSADDGYDGPGD